MPVVTNSYQAREEWQFANSRVIWQGFDPAEFPISTYQKGVLSLGRPMRERHHYRGHTLFQAVQQKLPPEFRAVSSPSVEEPSLSYQKGTSAYGAEKYQNYRDDIRKYSIYFNPTLRSPMPRSRGEAMMSGLVSVSANNHDVEMFIKNGWNGFYSNDAGELADYIKYLLKHPQQMREIALRSRKLATDLFNLDAFLGAWRGTLRSLLGSSVCAE
jgi:glycosyltransferase involved in cell wall biosynthesis